MSQADFIKVPTGAARIIIQTNPNDEDPHLTLDMLVSKYEAVKIAAFVMRVKDNELKEQIMSAQSNTPKAADVLVKAFDSGYEASQRVVGMADARYIKHQEIMVDQAQQQLCADILAIVDNDEEVIFTQEHGKGAFTSTKVVHDVSAENRNQFRVELRTAIREYFGVENE